VEKVAKSRNANKNDDQGDTEVTEHYGKARRTANVLKTVSPQDERLLLTSHSSLLTLFGRLDTAKSTCQALLCGVPHFPI